MFSGTWVETTQKEINIGIEDGNITTEGTIASTFYKYVLLFNIIYHYLARKYTFTYQL